jgi:DNA-directed RNA polymerase specialized sigma24 family protein
VTNLIAAKRAERKRLGRWERKLPRIIGPVQPFVSRHVNPEDKREPVEIRLVDVPEGGPLFFDGEKRAMLYALGDRHEVVYRDEHDRPVTRSELTPRQRRRVSDRVEVIPLTWDEPPSPRPAEQAMTPFYGYAGKLYRLLGSDAGQYFAEGVLRWLRREGGLEIMGFIVALARPDLFFTWGKNTDLSWAFRYIKTCMRRARGEMWENDVLWNTRAKEAEDKEWFDGVAESVYLAPEEPEAAYQDDSDKPAAVDRFKPARAFGAASFEKVDLRHLPPELAHDLKQIVYGRTILKYEVVEFEEDERDVISRRFIDGMKRWEVADELGVSETTVKRITASAKAKLQKIKDEGDLPDRMDRRRPYQKRTCFRPFEPSDPEEEAKVHPVLWSWWSKKPRPKVKWAWMEGWSTAESVKRQWGDATPMAKGLLERMTQFSVGSPLVKWKQHNAATPLFLSTSRCTEEMINETPGDSTCPLVGPGNEMSGLARQGRRG